MKKLYRNAYDSTIAGVCSGLADYLEIDKNVVRLLFIAGFIITASLFGVTYIVAWVILPIKNY